MEKTEERIVFIDYVRVAACFLVMLVHASEQFYGAPDGGLAGPTSYLANGADRLWVSVYDGFSRISVPLFMIVSAFLLAPMKQGLDTWTFYKKRMLRVVPPMLVFMVVYSALPLLWGGTTAATAAHDLARIPLNFPDLAGHLWFMYPLLGLYLFIPMISPWLRQATEKEERFFVILFAVSTCIPYLNRFFGEVWGECFWNGYGLLYNFAGYLGYLVLAHYIRVHVKWDNAKRVAVGLPCLIVGAVATILSFYLQATPGEYLVTPELEIGWSFCTINVVCATFGAFLLFSCIKAPKTPAIIREVSRLSFGMYLVHVLILLFCTNILKPVLPTVAAIPAIAVCTYLVSFAVTKLLSYIPGSKYFLGV